MDRYVFAVAVDGWGDRMLVRRRSAPADAEMIAKAEIAGLEIEIYSYMDCAVNEAVPYLGTAVERVLVARGLYHE